MTPIERQKLENLKAKAADRNLSEEERKKFARKAMNWADKFPGEKTKMLEEVYSEAKKEEKILILARKTKDFKKSVYLDLSLKK